MLCGRLCVSLWFCGALRVVHYTTEIMVQTDLICTIKFQYSFTCCNKVLFLEVGYGFTRMNAGPVAMVWPVRPWVYRFLRDKKWYRLDSNLGLHYGIASPSGLS